MNATRPWESPYFSLDAFLATETAEAFRAWATLSLASRDTTQPELQQIREGPVAEDQLPRWPSTLFELDRRCHGGFYGLSVLVGKKGLGKTLLALGSCLEAAATRDWQVVYFSAELDQQELAVRIGRYFERHAGSVDAVGFFHAIHLGKGHTLEDLCRMVEERTDPSGPRILVCIDSVTTAARLARRNFLFELEQLSLWSMLARRMSSGLASFLLVSEENKLGGAKGGALEYWADVVLKLAKPQGPGVDLVLEKSRRTLGEGKLPGPYARCLTRFEPPATRLRVVNDRDFDLEG